jgi:hypothetical protein
MRIIKLKKIIMKAPYLFVLLLLNVLIYSNVYSGDKNDFLSKNKAGMGLLPVPQSVSLTDHQYVLNSSWFIGAGNNISKADPALQSLTSALKERFGLTIKINSGANIGNKTRGIHLIIKAGAVKIGQTTDTNRNALIQQAYQLNLDKEKITITANAAQGLFYGVQSFIQLLQEDDNKIYFAGGTITDWPDMDVRMIYWDDAHHLDRLDAMKRALKQASFYKINAFALKLEGHFEFKSAKPVVEPYAYTAEEYQELTDYARAHYIELVPFLDAPAHIAFILKHPEYKSLRAFPNSNYELSVIDPKADQLMLGMMNDLIDANKGGKYFLFSTDEAYYVGMSEQEKKRADLLGGNGRLLAEYITRIANKLHERGRKVIIWGEYPLRPSDINSLPSHIINGVYDEKTAHKFKENKMRQLIYTSTQGEEPLFPNYYRMSPEEFSANNSSSLTDDEQQQGDLTNGRVSEMLKGITSAVSGDKADFMGVIVAAWADAGLNPETFWLGYATGASAGWNNKSVTGPELTSRFYNSFYGNNLVDIDKVYELLSTQAEFWTKSWEWKPSKNRTPIFGNSYGVYDTPKLAKDQVLPALPVPSGIDLSLNKDWSTNNQHRLEAAEKFLRQNDELMNLLSKSLATANCQQYNLQVLRSVAQLCRQNLTMLLGLQNINNLLTLSSDASAANPTLAVSLIDQALEQAKKIRNERNEVLQNVTAVWYQEWYPRVAEANGRKFLDKVDDVKDHRPARTVDMSYLIYRELKLPLDKWSKDVLDARNQFAKKNNLPTKSAVLNWEDIDL